jgi:hypothetical protein
MKAFGSTGSATLMKEIAADQYLTDLWPSPYQIGLYQTNHRASQFLADRFRADHVDLFQNHQEETLCRLINSNNLLHTISHNKEDI